MNQFNIKKFLTEAKLPESVASTVADLESLIDDYAEEVANIRDSVKDIKERLPVLRSELHDVVEWRDVGLTDEVESAQQSLKVLTQDVSAGMKVLNQMLSKAQSLEKALAKLPAAR